MDDYISREAAMRAIIDKQRDHTTPWRLSYELGKKHAADEYVEVLMAVPAADVVEVVRCSVCKKVVLEDRGNGKSAYWCPVNRNYRCWDEFCNRGERRAE